MRGVNFLEDGVFAALAGVGASLFGDGSDGDITVAGTTTLAADMFYNNLTVTGTLITAGFRVHVKETLTNTGTINWDGNAAVGSVAGAVQVAGTLQGQGAAGGAGGTNANGSNGSNRTGAYHTTPQSRGGSGGAAGARSGGTAGTVTQTAAQNGRLQGGAACLQGHLIPNMNGVNINTQDQGGSGGGGGAGSAAGETGGGGGGGGGRVWVCAKRILNNGTIRSTGGAGANGTTTNAGGGGGGGGGSVICLSGSFSGNQPTAAGGAKGLSGGGTGSDGVDGNAGLVVNLTI